MLRIEDLAYIGFVRKTHGYKGHLKIQIDLAEAGELETEQLFILIDEKPVPFFVEELSGSTDMWVVKLEDIDNETEAREFLNARVCVFRDQLSDLPQSEGLIDVVGYKLVDQNLGELGLVTEYHERNFQDLIEMNYSGETHLIPVDADIILDIDHQNKIIRVNLPDGLLHINH